MEMQHGPSCQVEEATNNKLETRISSNFCVVQTIFAKRLQKKAYTSRDAAEQDTAAVTADVLNAIQYLHDVGITHRDLKVLESSGGREGCSSRMAQAEIRMLTRSAVQLWPAKASILEDGAGRATGGRWPRGHQSKVGC
jgi:serine/threonine protein kinase